MAENKGLSDLEFPEFGETLFGLLKDIDDITAGRGECVFRGQADAGWTLTSGAVRRIRKSEGEDAVSKLNFRAYHYDLLENTRQHGFGFLEGRKLSSLELLAQLQHFKAATMLLDFSRSQLVALYFACKDEKDEDGKLFIVPIDGYEKLEDEGDVDDIIESGKIYQWPPIFHGEAERRMLVQSGLFLINLPEEADNETIFEVIIPSRDKSMILWELDQFCRINEDALFSDLAGFAQNRTTEFGLSDNFVLAYMIKNHDVDITKIIEGGSAKEKRGNYRSAIKFYDLVLKRDSEHVEAYCKRGFCKMQAFDCKGAIADFDNVICRENDPALEIYVIVAYYYRGFCKALLNDHEGAIKDYNEAIQRQPANLGLATKIPYESRSKSRLHLNQFDDAIEDLITVIELDSAWLQPEYFIPFHRDKRQEIRATLKEALNNALNQAANANDNERKKAIETIIKQLYPPQPKE